MMEVLNLIAFRFPKITLYLQWAYNGFEIAWPEHAWPQHALGLSVLGLGMLGLRVLGLRVLGLRVLGLCVLGLRVLGLRVLGLSAFKLKELGLVPVVGCVIFISLKSHLNLVENGYSLRIIGNVQNISVLHLIYLEINICRRFTYL